MLAESCAAAMARCRAAHGLVQFTRGFCDHVFRDVCDDFSHWYSHHEVNKGEDFVELIKQYICAIQDGEKVVAEADVNGQTPMTT